METTAKQGIGIKNRYVLNSRLEISVDWILKLSIGTLGISRIGGKSKRFASLELIPDIQRILNMAGVIVA
jgi:hypothetical protein